MKNKDIRQEEKIANIKLWQIADSLGIADTNFSKMLRKEFPIEQKEKVYAIISTLKQEDSTGGR